MAVSEVSSVSRIGGCLFGLAFGDALGADTEFLSVSEILRTYPPSGPQELKADLALVTDDTQMTLAVGEALIKAPQPYTLASLEKPLRTAFVEWMRSPDNNRAPGLTCMRACEALARGLTWTEATVSGSKGCGANMRVAPIGLLRLGSAGLTAETRAAIAQFQAALTHGHPTALAASDLTAQAIADLADGGDPLTLPQRLRQYALSQREVYHADWLGSLWQKSSYRTPQAFIAAGWDECLAALGRLDAALAHPDYTSDPCVATGAGWVAEEALATGLLCFLLYPDNPVAAIRRAAVTSGDSDSIACLAGAFAGAHSGLESWPHAWVQRIEYRLRLSALAANLAK